MLGFDQERTENTQHSSLGRILMAGHRADKELVFTVTYLHSDSSPIRK
jgi:hypothetical protein